MFNRSGWKARADRDEGIKRRENVRCKKMQKLGNVDDQLRHNCTGPGVAHMGAAWFHLSFGCHKWEKGKNVVTFCISVLPLTPPSFTSYSSSSILEAVMQYLLVEVGLRQVFREDFIISRSTSVVRGHRTGYSISCFMEWICASLKHSLPIRIKRLVVRHAVY